MVGARGRQDGRWKDNDQVVRQGQASREVTDRETNEQRTTVME